MTNVENSPSDWVAEHIERYVATGGEEGHIWQGVPTLLLTTTGRRSGQRRRTALIYAQPAENTFVVVGSRGGAPNHPAWYLNLVADPQVEVQVRADVFTAVARVAPPEERARLWPAMTEIWPSFDDYQAGTEREIPIVVLERAAREPLA